MYIRKIRRNSIENGIILYSFSGSVCVDEEGKLCGDVDYDSVSEIAEAFTPVPGGVGSITTAILLRHVVNNAER